jgi:hypothetical protein
MDGVHSVGLENAHEDRDENGNYQFGLRSGNICTLSAQYRSLEEAPRRLYNGVLCMVYISRSLKEAC